MEFPSFGLPAEPLAFPINLSRYHSLWGKIRRVITDRQKCSLKWVCSQEILKNLLISFSTVDESR